MFLHGSLGDFHICALLPHTSSAEGSRLRAAMAVMAPGQSPGVPEGNPFPMLLGLQGRKLPQNPKFPTLMDVVHVTNSKLSRTHCRGDTEAEFQLAAVCNHNRSCHSFSFFNAQVQKWCQSSPLRSSNRIKCPQMRHRSGTAAGCHEMPADPYQII